MSLRDAYKHLIGIPYKSGVDDCYGLARRYYMDNYGIELINFARPDGWWNDPEMDLINQFVQYDGWKNIGLNTRGLKVGDGLVFSLVSGKANHVGCYVGNGMFIHHVYGRFSNEEALMDKWTNRLLMIIRHPRVEESGKGMTPQVDILDFLAENVRARIIRPSQS